mgnify:CR=1 FL=1
MDRSGKINRLRREAQRPRLIVESPYAGDVEMNEAFAENVCRFAVKAGYNPYASHLLFTRFLDDEVAEERRAGIGCGFGWREIADEVWYCTRPDEAFTPGMELAPAYDDRHDVDLFTRELTFTQDGVLVAGWKGPLPEDVPEHLLGPDYTRRLRVAGQAR